MRKNPEFAEFIRKASKEDFEISSTLLFFQARPSLIRNIVSFIDKMLKEKYRMCDLGCGRGFVPYMLGELLGFKEVYGVDIDDRMISAAEKRLYKVVKSNLETDILPFPSNYFDLVTTFGVLEHLKWFDNPIKEAYRILKPNGLFLVSIPNLGDFVNRIRLLLGLQPRDITVTQLGTNTHIHTCTLKTLEQVLVNYNFVPLKAYGAKSPYRSYKILEFLDGILSRRPSMSLRFFLFAQKRNEKG